jgi:bile acid:Na+ symporter, BASS family
LCRKSKGRRLEILLVVRSSGGAFSAMFRLKDLILLVVIYASLLAGVVAPGFGGYFQPYPLYAMMSVLFLSFLSIRITDIRETVKGSAGPIVAYLAFRMLLLPVAIGLLFQAVWPEYALSALLLSGISSGVVAPFMSNMVRANTPAVLVVVIVSSLLVPFTLPILVKLLFAQSMEISLPAMIRMLLMVVFVPLVVAEGVRRSSQATADWLLRHQFPISLCLFAVTNLGIFSRYSDFFYQRPQAIAVATLVACILGALYFLAGLLVAWGRPLEDQLAAVIGLGIMNNVLVIVFSSQFFGPLEPTVAAMYLIPFFGLLLPLRAYRSWRTKNR